MSVILGCGFNGFSQLQDDTNLSGGLSNICSFKSEFIVIPIHVQKTKTEHEVKYEGECTNTDSSDQHDKHKTENMENQSFQKRNISIKAIVKDVIITWNSITYIRENGRAAYIGNGNEYIYDVYGKNTFRHIAKSWSHSFFVNKCGICSVVDESFGNGQPQTVRINPSLWTDLTDHAIDPTITTDKQSIDAEHVEVPIIRVTSGAKRTLAITENHTAATFDYDEDRDCFWLNPILRGIAIRNVSCGKEHVLILSRIGIVFTFGIGGQGQLGHGDIENADQPKIVEALEGVTMTAIAAGGWHSMVIADTGDMYVWGWNERGQLGLPSKMVRELNKTQIEQHNTTALTNNDPVDNSTNNDMRSTTSDEQSDAIRATVADQNTLVIDSEEIVTGKRRRENELSQDRDNDGNTRAADRLPVSQEDQGDLVNIQLLPVALDMHDDKGNDLVVTSISAGSRHSAAISDAGQVYTWGWNEYGQLGQGDTRHLDKPKPIPPLPLPDITPTTVHCGWWNTIILARSSLQT